MAKLFGILVAVAIVGIANVSEQLHANWRRGGSGQATQHSFGDTVSRQANYATATGRSATGSSSLTRDGAVATLPAAYLSVYGGLYDASGSVYYHHYYKGRVRFYAAVPPPYGVVLHAPPAASVTVVVGGATYYSSDYVYYRKTLTQGQVHYVVVPPPAGATVVVLPAGAATVTASGTKFYYYHNAFYRKVMSGTTTSYVVVSRPEAVTVVTALPPQFTTRKAGGVTYFACQNTYYLPYRGPDGTESYVVVDEPQPVSASASTASAGGHTRDMIGGPFSVPIGTTLSVRIGQKLSSATNKTKGTGKLCRARDRAHLRTKHRGRAYQTEVVLISMIVNTMEEVS
jgi:hypothetical protein